MLVKEEGKRGVFGLFSEVEAVKIIYPLRQYGASLLLGFVHLRLKLLLLLV